MSEKNNFMDMLSEDEVTMLETAMETAPVQSLPYDAESPCNFVFGRVYREFETDEQFLIPYGTSRSESTRGPAKFLGDGRKLLRGYGMGRIDLTLPIIENLQ